MKVVRQAALLIALAGTCAALTHAFHPRAPALYLRDAPHERYEVTIEQVEAQWKGDVIWVDARSRTDYEKEHVPGALLLNEKEWNDRLWEHQETLFAAEKPIVIYCARLCKASRKVAQRLRENTPLEQVYHLRGGWDAVRGRTGDRQESD